jgi:hypothetical protein
MTAPRPSRLTLFALAFAIGMIASIVLLGGVL